MSYERSMTREWVEALIVAVIFLGFSNTFVVKTFYIPSGSMEDTLLVGDHLFVNRIIYGPAPTQPERSLLPRRPVTRGDIVIFRSPREPEVDLVKRCVAVGGDTIRIENKQLFINDQKVDDAAYAVHKDPDTYRTPRDFYGLDERVVVPEGHLFCLGDNRDGSYDSRYWGFVPLANVKGRALLIYWSNGGETPDGTWVSWQHRMRQLGGTVIGFPTKTRWSRTFQLIR